MAAGLEGKSVIVTGAADGVGLSGGTALTLQVNEKFDWSVNLKIHERAGK